MDFHYDGVDYSIPGNTQILLTDLIETMHITVPDGDEDPDNDPLLDVNDVESVKFSDEHLVEVTQVSGLITIYGTDGKLADVDAGDYNFLLSSLAPFSTEEKLTITLKDGTVIEVGVTDNQDFVVKLKTVGDVTLDTTYYLAVKYWSGWQKQQQYVSGKDTYTFSIDDYVTPEFGIWRNNQGFGNGSVVDKYIVTTSTSEEGNILTLTKPADFKLKTEFFESDGENHPSTVPNDYYLLIKMVNNNGTYYHHRGPAGCSRRVRERQRRRRAQRCGNGRQWRQGHLDA